VGKIRKSLLKDPPPPVPASAVSEQTAPGAEISDTSVGGRAR
jgi:hypothetical protein